MKNLLNLKKWKPKVFYVKIIQSIKIVSVITLCLLIGTLADISCGKSSDITNICGLEGAWKTCNVVMDYHKHILQAITILYIHKVYQTDWYLKTMQITQTDCYQ